MRDRWFNAGMVLVGVLLAHLFMWSIGATDHPKAHAGDPYGNAHPGIERILQSIANKPIKVQCECRCPR